MWPTSEVCLRFLGCFASLLKLLQITYFQFLQVNKSILHAPNLFLDSSWPSSRIFILVLSCIMSWRHYDPCFCCRKLAIDYRSENCETSGPWSGKRGNRNRDDDCWNWDISLDGSRGLLNVFFSLFFPPFWQFISLQLNLSAIIWLFIFSPFIVMQ